MTKTSETNYESFDHLLHEMGLRKIEKERIDEYFRKVGEEKETRYLAKVSHILISLWDLASIVMKLKPGESLIIHGDSGRMFRGRISEQKLDEKFTELREKVAGRVSLGIDGNGRNERILARSGITSYGKSPFKKSWNNKVEALDKVEGNEDLYLFEQKFLRTDKKKVSEEIVKNDFGHEYLEISIKDYPTTIGIGIASGRVSYTITDGKIEYLR